MASALTADSPAPVDTSSKSSLKSSMVVTGEGGGVGGGLDGLSTKVGNNQ